MNSLADTFTGGCHCGEVRYEMHGKIFNATLCHCTLCRGTTGAPVVAWCSIDLTSFRFTHGHPRSYQSTRLSTRTFCASCGTQLTFFTDGETSIDITTASLDEPDADAVSPQDQIFTRSELPWMNDMHALPRFNTKRITKEE